MSRPTIERVGLYARTIRHLRPSQLLHRVRLRGQRRLIDRYPGVAGGLLRRRVDVSGDVGWPAGFEPLGRRTSRDLQDAGRLRAGCFDLLNVERQIGWPPDWSPGGSQLWSYHLHYLEWLWSLRDDGGSPGEFAEIWRSWRDANPLGASDAWHPYVASLRAWVLCELYGPFVRGQAWEREFVDDLALHAGYLLTHLERDVGGNHLLKNLKALVGLGVFLEDDELLRVGLRGIEEQLDVQVLPDGGHFELSPSYHAQVLEDLVDIARLLRAGGRVGPASLGPKIEAMRGWLSSMLLPDGDVPLFNDCVRVGSDRLEALGVRPVLRDGLTLLPDSGYFVARAGPFHLVGDVGLPCPDELPAHAQADCLSFVLAVDGERVIVDTGTSTYEGPRRDYERSTRAHNTVEIGGQDQTEVWGRFRAGRRARPTIERASEDGDRIVVQASHDGYRRLAGAPVHRRRWELTNDGLTIVDEVTSDECPPVRGFLHLAPGTRTERVSQGVVEAGPLRIEIRSDAEVETSVLDPGTSELTFVGTDFNRREPSPTVVQVGSAGFDCHVTVSRQQ